MRVRISKTPKGELTIREFCPARKSVIAFTFTALVVLFAVLALVPATMFIGIFGGIASYVSFWIVKHSNLATKVTYKRDIGLSYSLPGALHHYDVSVLESAYKENSGLVLELLSMEDEADECNIKVNKSGFTLSLPEFQDHVYERDTAEQKAAELREELAL